MGRFTVMGVLLLAASLLLSLVVQAAVPGEDYPYFGPQTFENHKYYYFGDSSFSAGSRQGITIELDEDSVSYQSVKATVMLDYNLIMDRQITMFNILANGVLVDSFEPYFDRSRDPAEYSAYYYIDINVSDQYIGSDNFFQIVGIKQGKYFGEDKNDYVVAWSQQTNVIRFKSLPVIDRDAIEELEEQTGVLYSILDKLEKLKSMLEGKLDSLKVAIEDIYKVKPETQERFDSALAALQQALPSQQVSDQMDQVAELMDESKSVIERGSNDLKFLKVAIYGNEYYFLDFSQLEKEVKMIRDFLALILWVEFFFSVIRLLVPKLTA